MLIQSQNKPIENKEDKGLNSAKCGQVQKNPQTIRKQNGDGKTLTMADANDFLAHHAAAHSAPEIPFVSSNENGWAEWLRGVRM